MDQLFILLTEWLGALVGCWLKLHTASPGNDKKKIKIQGTVSTLCVSPLHHRKVKP